MATTTNNGWSIPVSSDLVRNGWQAINTLGSAIDTSLGKVAYTTFTPTITGTSSGWSLGSGSSSTGRYCKLGNTVFVDGTITLGTSPSAGANAFAIALPTGYNANSNTSEWITTGWFYSSAATIMYPCTLKITSTKIEFYIQKATSSTGPIKAVAFDSTNTPVTVASTDVFGFSITYQAA